MKPDRAPLMTVDEFLVWAEGRPGRYELVDGKIYEMASERVRHTRAKFAAALALLRSVEAKALPCEILQDGATVRIDAKTAFEPDALVRCGPPIDDDAIETPDPLIVVEILSPGTRNYDAGAKLIGYFAVPSLRHYLMVDPIKRVIVHHRREGDEIAMRIIGTGTLHLDPPGLDLTVEDLLGGVAP